MRPGEESIDATSEALAEAQYQEVLRRLRELEDGEDELIEWEQVRAELLTRIDRRLS
ncbi:addiction module protein [Nannocystis pusilla]|uniref:addiction module protein n=1 Tax=Nannocystis pusilla TaxID=889268 RepID=UPI003B7BC47D